mgnify:CR=1 FL=1
MKIVTAEHTQSTPWANGTGITHEYARVPGPKGYAWRMSLAEVSQDGAFSTFPGMARILTVVQGAGMVLQTAHKDQSAEPLLPVQFTGDIPVIGRLTDGPVLNFNLIYDPHALRAKAYVLHPGDEMNCKAITHRSYALFVVRGAVMLDGHRLLPQQLAIFDHGKAPLSIDLGAAALVYELNQIALNR